MTTLSAVQNEAHDALKYIKDNLVGLTGTITSPLLGSSINATFTNSSTDFVSALFAGYAGFKAKYTAGMPTAITQIHYRDLAASSPSSNYSAYQLASIPDSLGSSNLEIVIPGVTGDLQTQLDKIAKMYSLLEPKNYKLYTSGLDGIKIRAYNTATHIAKNASVTTDKTELRALLCELFTGSTTGCDTFTVPANADLFVVRRLLQLYLAMANIYISMKLYESNATGTNYKDLLKLTYGYLRRLNLSVLDTDVNEIKTETTERVRTFNKNGLAINELNSNVSELQSTLKANKERVDSAVARDKKARVIAYWGVGVASAIIAIAAAVYFAPLEDLMKRLIIGSLAIIGIVTFLVFRYLYKSTIESFAISVSSIINYNAAITDTDLINNLDNISISIISDATQYLQNTIQLALTFSAYRGYGNMNTAMAREIGNFEIKKMQMSNSVETLNQAENIIDLDGRVNAARLTLLLSLLIIVVFTLFGVLYLPAAAKTLYIIAGIALFIAVTLYFVDTTSRVRTDGKKMYWGSPAAKKDL